MKKRGKSWDIEWIGMDSCLWRSENGGRLVCQKKAHDSRELAMKILVFVFLVFFLVAGSLLFPAPFSLTLSHLNEAYAQTPEGRSSKASTHSLEGHRGGMMMGEWTEGMGHEMMRDMMRERMKDAALTKEVPFYQEKTFLVIITGALVLFIIWAIGRRGLRPWRRLGKRAPFINEAILVVDLCESTKLAVTQGDAFAMRIQERMKQCVREVSERFGASFFENTGDGYLITFPAGIGAVRAAIQVLQNANDYNGEAPEKEKIELRVAINYGELILDEQQGRHGAAINKAFRIEGLQEGELESLGGGLKPKDFPERNRIFLSEEVKEEINGARAIPIELVGVFNLKGFTGLHRVYSVPWREIPLDS